MYPLPRLLLLAALVVGVGYGLVAVAVLLPKMGSGIFVYMLPFLFLALTLWFIGRDEPTDQTPVHLPRTTSPQLSQDPVDDEPQAADPLATEPQDSGDASPREMSDADFDALEDRVDDLAAHPRPDRAADGRSDAAPVSGGPIDEQAFTKLVSQAIDDLPPEFAQALDHVAVVVSNQGAVQRHRGRLRPLYGLYVGYGGRGSVLGAPRVGGAQPDRIVIFRDTLTHDFGNDPDRLRLEVTRTLRHELAHHLGYDEPGVHSLGL